jgi:hypothetical protein
MSELGSNSINPEKPIILATKILAPFIAAISTEGKTGKNCLKQDY